MNAAVPLISWELCTWVVQYLEKAGDVPKASCRQILPQATFSALPFFFFFCRGYRGKVKNGQVPVHVPTSSQCTSVTPVLNFISTRSFPFVSCIFHLSPLFKLAPSSTFLNDLDSSMLNIKMRWSREAKTPPVLPLPPSHGGWRRGDLIWIQQRGSRESRDQKKASKVNPEAIHSVVVELHSEKATVRRRRGLDLYGPPGTVSLHSTMGEGPE